MVRYLHGADALDSIFLFSLFLLLLLLLVCSRPSRVEHEECVSFLTISYGELAAFLSSSTSLDIPGLAKGGVPRAYLAPTYNYRDFISMRKVGGSGH